MLYSGKLIKSIRKYYKLSLEKLCYGVCTYGQLARIERGERNAEKLLFECIYQRLGKYSGRFEELLDLDEYNLTQKRWQIQEYIDNKCFKEAENEIIEYYQLTDSNLHLQLLCLYKCEIMHRTDCDIKKCMDILREGLHYTLPNFKFEDFENYYLGRIELYIIAQYARYMELYGETDFAINIYHRLLDYISSERYDRSERGNHYRHIGYWLSMYYLKHHQYEKALELAEKTYEEIIKNDFWIFLYEIKEIITTCKDNLGQNVSNDKMLLLILKNMNEEYAIMLASDFFPRYNEERAYCFNDFIKQRRLLFGISQEEFADGICDVTTLSRMENKKYTIGKKAKAKMLQKVNMSGDEYISSIDTYDYRVYEILNKLNDCIKSQHLEDKSILINELKQVNIDCTFNTQQCLVHRFAFKDINDTEYICTVDDFFEILSKTLIKCEPVSLNNIILTENEWHVIFSLSRILKDDGKLQLCKQYFESILYAYEQLPSPSIYTMYIHIYSALGEILGELSNIQKANDYLKEGMRISAKSDSILRIADFAYDSSWNILETKQQLALSELKECERMLSYAYLMCDIHNNEIWKSLIYELCTKYNLTPIF